ncbi:MAG: hypothetical protein LBQ54_06290 [Planctomycetaceae bacterium]|nr:hypothetical protein [Planctomycetaceae bacterium]
MGFISNAVGNYRHRLLFLFQNRSTERSEREPAARRSFPAAVQRVTLPSVRCREFT